MQPSATFRLSICGVLIKFLKLSLNLPRLWRCLSGLTALPVVSQVILFELHVFHLLFVTDFVIVTVSPHLVVSKEFTLH
jgi:hypothetical protein